MANRILIIVTRMRDEFEPYWDAEISEFECKGDNFTKPIYKKIGQDELIIVDGWNLKNHSLNELLACANLFEVISNAGIIGIISHGLDSNLLNIDFSEDQRVFTQKYSSTLGNDFCESKNSTFVANEDPAEIRPGVLDAFRDALVFDKSEDIISDAFNNLWKYFNKDSNLNIKLKILHQCLIQKDAQQIVWPDELDNEKKARSNFEYLKEINSTDLFDSNYLNSLTNLRDSLLSR